MKNNSQKPKDHLDNILYNLNDNPEIEKLLEEQEVLNEIIKGKWNSYEWGEFIAELDKKNK